MPSKDKMRRDASSDSDRPTMDTANRQQEIKSGNRNVTAEGETSRSVNERTDVERPMNRVDDVESSDKDIHGPDGQNYDSSVERDSSGGMDDRTSSTRGVVET